RHRTAPPQHPLRGWARLQRALAVLVELELVAGVQDRDIPKDLLLGPREGEAHQFRAALRERLRRREHGSAILPGGVIADRHYVARQQLLDAPLIVLETRTANSLPGGE